MHTVQRGNEWVLRSIEQVKLETLFRAEDFGETQDGITACFWYTGL